MGYRRFVLTCVLAVLPALGTLAAAQGSNDASGSTGMSGIDQKLVDQLTEDAMSGKLKGLRGPLLRPELGNCAMNQLELQEQGYRFAGGLGGLDFTDLPGPAADSVTTASAQAPLLQALTRGVTQNDVGIMIVDDFGNAPNAELGPSIFTKSGASLSESLGDYLSGLEASGQVSHGALVYAYTLALVAHLPKTTFAGFGPSSRPDHVLQQAVFKHEGLHGGSSHRIVVQAVDTTHYDTHVIATGIDNGFRMFAKLGIRRVAVNMSFAIVPCSVKDDYERSGSLNIDDYAKEILDAGYGTFEKNLLDALKFVLFTPVTPPGIPEDWVQYYFANGYLPPLKGAPKPSTPPFRGADAVVALASSGNDGQPFPYAPAMWPHIIAVGATDASDGARAGFSNGATIITTGAWPRVEDLAEDVTGAVGPTSPVGTVVSDKAIVAGTSFASPGAAVFTALDLMGDTPRCWVSGEGEPRLYAADYPNDALDSALIDRKCRP